MFEDMGPVEIALSVRKFAESLWRVMVWACDEKVNAVIFSLKKVNPYTQE